MQQRDFTEEVYKKTERIFTQKVIFLTFCSNQSISVLDKFW
jgi:hypothetical protein